MEDDGDAGTLQNANATRNATRKARPNGLAAPAAAFRRVCLRH